MSPNSATPVFGRSAVLAEMHRIVPAAVVAPLLADVLRVLDADDPDTVARLAAIPMDRLTFAKLALWRDRVLPNPHQDRLGHAAAKFLGAQTLASISLRPTVFDNNFAYPPSLPPAFERAVEGLFIVGHLQFDALARLANRVIAWLDAKGKRKVALIESPIGNTVPTQLLKALADRHGLDAEIIQWNAPRNDQAREGRTVEDAATDCAEQLKNFDCIVLVDESLTGTRFIKLYDALIPVIDRSCFLPIAMFFHDVRRPKLSQHANRTRLIERLRVQGQTVGYEGTHIEFPRHKAFKVDAGNHVFWESPVIWGNSELIAGKRKVNLVFMLLEHFFALIADMGLPQSELRTFLEIIWARNELGQHFKAVPGVTRKFFEDAINDLPLHAFRERLWQLAKMRFPADYAGSLDELQKTGVIERYNWTRDAFTTEATQRIGDQRAWCLWNAVDAVFSGSLFEQTLQASRDLDATLYTLPFNETIRHFNRRLIDRLVARSVEL